MEARSDSRAQFVRQIWVKGRKTKRTIYSLVLSEVFLKIAEVARFFDVKRKIRRIELSIGKFQKLLDWTSGINANFKSGAFLVSTTGDEGSPRRSRKLANKKRKTLWQGVVFYKGLFLDGYQSAFSHVPDLLGCPNCIPWHVDILVRRNSVTKNNYNNGARVSFGGRFRMLWRLFFAVSFRIILPLNNGY